MARMPNKRFNPTCAVGGFGISCQLWAHAGNLGVRRRRHFDMSVGYLLVNNTRTELISFAHLPASAARELAGNPVAAAITTWYLLEHRGDQISFVSDTNGDWPFLTGSPVDLAKYDDMTDAVVQQLISASILRDDGILWADDHEPDTIYVRKLTNVWMD